MTSSTSTDQLSDADLEQRKQEFQKRRNDRIRYRSTLRIFDVRTEGQKIVSVKCVEEEELLKRPVSDCTR